MARRTQGEGCVVQRPDGRWQASLQVDGRRRTLYGKTRQEVYRKLADLQRQTAASGALPNSGTRTVNDLLDLWLETATPTLKPRTLADYRQTSRLYLRPALGKTRLGKLTPDRLQRLYSDLQRRGLQRGAAKAHAVLHRALKLAVLWGWLAENPASRVLRPQYRPKRKDVWTPQELSVFLAGAKGHWLYPVWHLAIASGCRIGELCALTWQDVDFDACTIQVSKALQRIGGEWVTTAPKTRSGERTIALPGEALQVLRRQRAQQAEWRLKAGPEWANAADLVFTQWSGAPLHGATVSHGLMMQCRRLGLPEVTPHGLRHLHGSLLLDQGLPVPAVSARLGHAHPGVTMTVYAHLVGNRDDAGAGAIARAMGGL